MRSTKLRRQKEKAQGTVRHGGGGGSRFEVDHSGRTYVVDLENKTCGCFKWQLTGIPCSHDMCCIVKTRAEIDNFIDPFYTREKYLQAYEHIIEPLPGHYQYIKTGQPKPEPPSFVIQPGRPKKNARRRGEGEEPPSRTVKRIRPTGANLKCSVCKALGHNKRTCKAAHNPPGNASAQGNNNDSSVADHPVPAHTTGTAADQPITNEADRPISAATQGRRGRPRGSKPIAAELRHTRQYTRKVSSEGTGAFVPPTQQSVNQTPDVHQPGTQGTVSSPATRGGGRATKNPSQPNTRASSSASFGRGRPKKAAAQPWKI